MAPASARLTCAGNGLTASGPHAPGALSSDAGSQTGEETLLACHCPLEIDSQSVDLIEFEGRVYDALIELQKVCDAAPSVRDQKLPSDLRELLSIVRTAASELILCSSVREAIDRLKQDQKALGAVEYVASFGRTDDEIKAAIRRAFENRTEDTPALPCMAFCSYLIELCDELKPGKGPHKT